MADARPIADTMDVEVGARGIARRDLLPSPREQRLGLVEDRSTEQSTPSPVIEEEARPRRSMREAFASFKRQIDIRNVAGPYGSRPIVILCGIGMVSGWDNAAFNILGPQIRDELGFNLAFLAVLTSVLEIAEKALAPLFGWLADRVHRVRMMAIGNIVASSATVTMGVMASPGGLAASRVIGSAGGAVAGPTGLPLLTDWYPQEARARVIAFATAAGKVGGVLGPVVAGLGVTFFGWRAALIGFGIIAVAVSFLLLLLPEPPRGALDRLRMGADAETAVREQPPMSWAEAWRACASVTTVRRIWYATPFLGMAGGGIHLLTNFYFYEEYGVSTLGLGLIASAMALVGAVGAVLAAPLADRLLATAPGKIMAAFGVLLLLNIVPVLALVFSPWLWVSIVISLPLGFLATALGPALAALLSLVVPARLRGLGMQTFKPWEIIGTIGLILIAAQADGLGLRTALLVLLPVYVIGALLVTSAAGGVARDIRAATAASMADEESRRAREEGRTKLLVCRDVDVTYDGTPVLFNVDFDVEDGELVALLGTNGAGKSTLLRAITGVQEASNGAIFLDGRDITHRPPAENAKDGVVFVPGGRAVFPSLTVIENLRVAGYLDRDDHAAVDARVEEVLGLFPSLRERLHEVAGNLSGGEQQMVAIGQAFVMRPRLLMIDELSLGLAPAVVERLLDVVRRINEQGTTVILVEQSINVALTIARRAVFLEKGMVRFDGPTAELLGRSDLVRSVFLAGAGGSVRPATRRRVAAADEVQTVLDVADVAVSYGGVQALRGASVSVDAGEVVGIIGPNGAGKTTLFDVVSGFVTPDEGRVSIAGVAADSLGPDARARLGLARSFQNARLFGALTVRDTIAVALETHIEAKSAVAAALWLPPVAKSERRVARRVAWLLELFGLEAYADKFVSELSTGSRRIVDLACIMATEPKILLLDEPSSGLAQAESEALAPVVRRLARDAGCGVLVIEHDIPLVTSLSDCMIAMELGRPIVEGAPDEVVNHPRVVEAYLGTDASVVERSGPLSAALAAAGLTDPTTRRTT